MDSTAFRTTLRAMATATDPQERMRLYDMLASELAVALNNQSNRAQVTIWEAQESAYAKIDSLHAHQADTNLMLATVISSMAAIQTDVTTMLGVQGENAARLGKMEGQWEEAMTLLRESQRHRAQLQSAVDALEARMIPAEDQERMIREHDALIEQMTAIDARVAALELLLAAQRSESSRP